MKQTIEIVERDESRTIGFDVNKMVDTEDKSISPIVTEKKRGPGRPPKSGPVISYTDLVTVDKNNAAKKKNSYATQLEEGYKPQASLLMGAVAQADYLYNNLETELEKYRENKGYGGKSRQITIANYLGTQVSAIGAKITAVRELNTIRNNINNMVLKKEQMMKDTGEENSDKKIQDAYYALVNAASYGLPRYTSPLAQSSINTGVNLSGVNIPTSTITGGVAPMQSTGIVQSTGGGNPITTAPVQQSMNPIQARMIAEHNPNIKTVVIYDQSTGNKAFDVIDITTGQSVPGIQRPAPFLLDDMRPDLRNGIASNSNANVSYPLVLIGNRAADEL